MKPPPTPRVLYRLVDSLTENGPVASLEEWHVTRETPKTYLVELWGRRHRVLKGAHKQFACLTREAALGSYRARKARQVKILSAQLYRAKAALTWSQGDDPLKLVPALITFLPKPPLDR